MPFAPVITPESTADDVQDQLLAAGHYMRELRSRPEDQRGDTYQADMRSAVDAVH